MLYKCLKRMIEKSNYDSKEEMLEKVSILYANNQLSKEQYEDLVNLLEAN